MFMLVRVAAMFLAGINLVLAGVWIERVFAPGVVSLAGLSADQMVLLNLTLGLGYLWWSAR